MSYVTIVIAFFNNKLRSSILTQSTMGFIIVISVLLLGAAVLPEPSKADEGTENTNFVRGLRKLRGSSRGSRGVEQNR